eukprot:m.102592 g.102592  ORF g.102592 m.102592 type:complete len:68 (+) comp13226_c0_seq1:710-913(+)
MLCELRMMTKKVPREVLQHTLYRSSLILGLFCCVHDKSDVVTTFSIQQSREYYAIIVSSCTYRWLMR